MEDLSLDKIVANLEKYFRRMPYHTRVAVTNSWMKVKEGLEKLPRMKDNLPKLKLTDLPKLSDIPDEVLPDEYSFIDDCNEVGPEIEGDFYQEGLFDSNIREGLDVVIYTRSPQERPWVGRVLNILLDKKFSIHWFERHGKSGKFHAMENPDGTPYASELENSSVMMWDIATQSMDKSFHVTPYRLGQIVKEYKKYDNMNNI